MKRFHVHVSVPDIDRSVGFYSALFGAEPAVTRPDYAKWMLEDPRVNFAISTRGAGEGVNHLGFQVDSEDELALLRTQAQSAGLALIDEAGANCCYAHANKHWLADPAKVAWEVFHTLGEIEVYGKDRPDVAAPEAAGVCCPTKGAAATKPAACCPAN